MKKLIETSDNPTLSKCAYETDHDSDCLPYFVSEDTTITCNCCTETLDLRSTTSKRNVYKVERSKPTIQKFVDIPINIMKCDFGSFNMVGMDPFVIIRDKEEFVQPKDHKALTPPRTFTAYLKR